VLLPSEFMVGHIGDIAEFTLVLPVDSYDRTCLVTTAPGKPTAIVIGENDFVCFESQGNTVWKGLLVPNIMIEIDETSIMDATRQSPPLGSLVRQANGIFVHVRHESSPMRTLVPIVTSLPTCEAHMAAGFKKWQIVIGEGTAKRVLKKIDADQLNKSKG
jgi:hypothetical protein